MISEITVFASYKEMYGELIFYLLVVLEWLKTRGRLHIFKPRLKLNHKFEYGHYPSHLLAPLTLPKPKTDISQCSTSLHNRLFMSQAKRTRHFVREARRAPLLAHKAPVIQTCVQQNRALTLFLLTNRSI